MKHIITIFIMLLCGIAGSGQNITYAEYFLDDDPGPGAGTAIPLTPSATVDLDFTVPLEGLSPGFHFLYLRAKDNDENWSFCHVQPVLKDILQSQDEMDIMYAEYFMDDDPGYGNGTPIAITPSPVVDVSLNIDLSGLDAGFHFVYLRARTGEDAWSILAIHPFLLDIMQVNEVNITRVEYYIDDDPGPGNGIDVPVNPALVIDLDFLVQPESLEAGLHFICIRARDEDGVWSLTHVQPFLYNFMQEQADQDITYLEYFVDDDPGYGNAISVELTPSPVIDMDLDVDLSEINPGFHYLVLRARDEDGIWSLCHVQPFISGLWGEASDITHYEYFFDEEPGYGNGNVIEIDPPAQIVSLDFEMDLSELAEGEHLVYSRAKDANGAWSAIVVDTLEVLPPVYETALAFDGMDEYLSVDGIIFPEQEMTIEAWINPNEMNNLQEIVYFYGENAGVQFRLNDDGSLLYGESANGNWNWVVSASNAILPGNWTHIAVTKIEDQCQLYINGLPGGLSEFDNDPVTNAMSMAGRGNFLDRFFDGQMDEIRLWNVARTQEELENNMCTEFTGNETGLYGIWHFNEGPENAVTLDATINQFEATLNNMQPDSGPECSWQDHECAEPEIILEADFSAEPIAGDTPLPVQFTDLSTGNRTSWLWDFGDGQTSTLQNPLHLYTVPENYSVELTVSDGVNLDVIIKNSFVTVTEPPITTWAAEYFFDEDPGFGNGISVPVQEGDDVIFGFEAQLSGLDDGLHTLYVRTRQDNGSWTQTFNRSFLKQHLPGDTYPNLTYLEYFFDSDPGFGEATPITFDALSAMEVTINLPLEALDYGIHTLYVRSQDENGRWSIVMQRTFIMGNYPGDPLKELARAEYFIDEDPGQGNAEPVIFDPNNGIHNQQFDANLDGLEWGAHMLYVRTMDESGNWSIAVAEPINVEEPPIIAEFSADITTGSVPLNVQFTDETYISEPTEWLWYFGDGNTSTAQNPQHTYADPGIYSVTLTATNAEGTDTEIKEDYITVYPPLYSLEYFFDVDPGYGNATGVYAYSSNLGGFDFLVPVDGLEDGYHLLFVRIQDTANVWTQTFTRSILKTRLPGDPDPNITQMEYFVDDDPGFGQANSIPVSQSTVPVVETLIPLDGYADGLHNIFVRSQDENGRWSETMVRPFLKSYVPGVLANVSGLEYFIDEDPGVGNGTSVSVPNPQANVERSFVVNLGAQIPGEHRLFVRAVDDRGHWSIVYNQLIEVTATGAVQVVQLPEGWSGISSYIIPDDGAVENIFASIEDELVILQNFDGMYWPTAGVNTLSNWDDHAGYQVKMETAKQVTFSGSTQENLTANLNAGWNYLPVLNACDNNAEELFSQIIGNLQIVKDVAGTGVYWPQFGVNTLQEIVPGKAYFVLVDEDVSLEFPECIGDQSGLKQSRTLSGFGTLTEFGVRRTPLAHSIAFPLENSKDLEIGDIITIYNQSGLCCGAALFQNQNMVITAFGDDPTTPQVDGMVEGELLQFHIFNPETGKEFPLTVEFDYSMPNGENFVTNGLSAVKSLQVAGVDDLSGSGLNISIYPNPSKGVFEVSTLTVRQLADQSEFEWEVTDTHGSIIALGNDQFNDFTIDISSHPKGIYYLKITKGGLQMFRKLVLQ